MESSNYNKMNSFFRNSFENEQKKKLISHLVLVVRCCTDEKLQIHRYALPSLLLS